MEPYPYCTLELRDQTANGYRPILDQGLGNLALHGITLGSVVADGNMAQKKCFDLSWSESLRHVSTHSSLRSVIFIPCLCHRVDNALKNHSKKCPNVHQLTEHLHQIAYQCREHKIAIGAICPSHVATRWVYDFDILEFIRRHDSKIRAYIKIPKEFDLLYPIMSIFKQLIKIFESSRTFHFSAFIHLERACNALKELDLEHKNPYAEGFAESLTKYTLESKEAGIWVLSYILTRKGHDDFFMRIKGNSPTAQKCLQFFTKPKVVEVDELDDVVDDFLNDEGLQLQIQQYVIPKKN